MNFLLEFAGVQKSEQSFRWLMIWYIAKIAFQDIHKKEGKKTLNSWKDHLKQYLKKSLPHVEQSHFTLMENSTELRRISAGCLCSDEKLDQQQDFLTETSRS